jgi:hypothetical protein
MEKRNIAEMNNLLMEKNIIAGGREARRPKEYELI